MSFTLNCAERLKIERKRLGLKQSEAADLCFVARTTWGQYERGLVVPGGNALFYFASHGADIQYILTGKRSQGYDMSLTLEEEKLINQFRNASKSIKAAAIGALIAGNSPTTSINVSGHRNRVAGRDFHENKK